MQPSNIDRHTLYDVLFVAASAGLWWIKFTYSLWRRTRYLEELLRRERRSESAKLDGLRTRMLEHFFKEPKPTLQALADDTETDFDLKP